MTAPHWHCPNDCEKPQPYPYPHMLDCWHTQLRLVAQYFPGAQLRALKDMRLARGGVFVYVSATVARRETLCPPHVVANFQELGYTVIHVQEPR